MPKSKIDPAHPQRPKATKKRAARPKSASESQIKRAAKNEAIATELAPAVAIALLDKTEQAESAPAPALECLAAAAVPSETEGKVRVQLLFENGAVLPVEMSAEAGAALSKGLTAQESKS